ncbi:MAG: hypothetical protein A2Z06_01320 [Candidatus Glassbacteria bacterium RBG_16_58_8]|uniref:HTH cro/C1-type domain-containing protein n=1 Tax=Candidatus Glassbacteria bacterium RBG_16_58_8 TaxID=1817866 RepID=A0A1F5YBV7_9BACT|nr:MAG: hypothetical protein A2Z06_01320 [Candidatus Glassbacteria bacterium RBG_16_58_8]
MRGGIRSPLRAPILGARDISLAGRILAARDAGVPFKVLAKKTGISGAYLGQIATKGKTPSQEVEKKIRTVLSGLGY